MDKLLMIIVLQVTCLAHASIDYDTVRPNTIRILNKYARDKSLKFQLNNAQITETLSEGEILVIKTDSNVNVTILAMEEVNNVTEYQLFWNMSVPNFDREMCFNIGFDDARWWNTYTEYGQTVPIKPQRAFKRSLTTGDCNSNRDICGILETMFLNSHGFALYADKKAPLFLHRDPRGNDPWLCFSVGARSPYPTKNVINKMYDRQFSIYLAVASNAKAAYQYLAGKYLPKVTSKPDASLIEKPVWSTYARYGKDVNDDKLWKYAREIKQYKFPFGMIELDDRWEPHYGDWVFDPTKFTNTFTFADIKDMGFKVGLWIHPFVNVDSQQYKTPGNNRYFLKRSNNDVVVVGWWDGSGAVVDFTNANAAEWYFQQLDTLRNKSNIDTFTCWGGELSYLGGDYQFYDYDAQDNPNQFTTAYMNTCAKFGNLVSVTSSYGMQAAGQFVRMHDKNPVWEAENNGLGSVIGTALTMSLAGYPFIMSEMIGGTGGTRPDEELYVRWMQASTLLPAMQFSHAPWEFSEQTVQIALKMLELRAQFTPKMLEIAGISSNKTENGTLFMAKDYNFDFEVMDSNDTKPSENTTSYEPIIRPMWWSAPEDDSAYTIGDQFMVGDDLIVAPVITKGAVQRLVYLPEGTWKDPEGKSYSGPIQLMYKAPIDVLPYFVRAAAAEAWDPEGV